MTVKCPKCDVENEIDYEAGDETLVCRSCDALLLVCVEGDKVDVSEL